MPPADPEARLERALKSAGLVAGPALALAVFLVNPGDHPEEARRLLAILALAVAWWITEAIPLPATALTASALAIAAGVAPARQVLAPYADPVIFLFLGSFLLAEASSRYGLHVALASRLLGFPFFARTAAGRMSAFGTASAAISTVLSKTAAAALMTPIALGASATGRRAVTFTLIADGEGLTPAPTRSAVSPRQLVIRLRILSNGVAGTMWDPLGTPAVSVHSWR